MAGPGAHDTARADGDTFIGAAAEWAYLYGQYLTHAVHQSTRTAALSQLVVDGVARGHLSPSDVPESLAGFVRSHGSEYAQRITGLNAHFLAELIQLSIEQHVEHLDSTTDSMARPEFDASDPVRCFQ